MYNLTRELCKESKHCLSHCWGASVAYRSACEAIGTQDYSIESDIACGLLKAKSPYCPNLDFFTIDSSLKKQTFIDGKSCFLQSGCFRDLDNYYDSLMDLYTTPPKGIDGKCNTFYDKFQKIQCESLKTMLRNEIRDTNGDKKFNATRIAELSERAQKCASKLNCSQEHSQKEITGATCENVGVEYYFFEHQCMIPFTREVYKKEHNCAEDFEAVLRCQKDACLTSRVLKKAIKQNCDYAKMISAELKNIFELHPEYSRCECLKRMSYLDVFNAYKRCTWMDQKMNCWLYAIMDSCKRPEKFALGQCPHERPSYGFPPVLFSDPPPRVFLYMSDDK
ncbi:Protein CBG04686 [Caenorhabditis briggsae]|uniref:Protein CBG04686 n=1 Tax=Caenorhabditis briggsae TaxID=6238 RepID=A8WY84_CAEBR|nr:Protein CBG04686 [Caenorhabditis briggsae]CAP25342.1 Protein CBG04686 [Caenorhabditis briggsae]